MTRRIIHFEKHNLGRFQNNSVRLKTLRVDHNGRVSLRFQVGIANRSALYITVSLEVVSFNSGTDELLAFCMGLILMFCFKLSDFSEYRCDLLIQ
jgi:hypothetical protein